jgi:hypothetical protein
MNPSTLGSHELGADVRFFECNRERRSLRGDLRGVGLRIILAMDATEIIRTIDAEIAGLEKAPALLKGHTTIAKRGRPVSSKPVATLKPERREMSAEGRARIAGA